MRNIYDVLEETMRKENEEASTTSWGTDWLYIQLKQGAVKNKSYNETNSNICLA